MRVKRGIKSIGSFWLPESIKRTDGYIEIIDGGVTTLFLNHPIPECKNNDLIEILHGKTLNNQNVTLFSSFETLTFPGNLGAILQKTPIPHHVHEIIFGRLYNSIEEVMIIEASFQLNRLNNWLPIGYKSSFIYCNETEVSLTCTKTTNVKIKTAIPMSFSYYKELIKQLLMFFTFIIGEVINICKLSIRDENRNKLECYYQSPLFEKKKSLAQHIFIEYTLLQDITFIELLKNWLSIYHQFYPALYLYFSFLTNGHAFLDTKFIALAQALEGYHRLKNYNELRFDAVSFDQLRLNIINICPTDDYKKWITTIFEHGNEINFSKRIKLLIKPFRNLIGSGSERKILIDEIYNTRNLLTHISLSNAEKIYSDKKLDRLCFRSDAILCLLILHDLGLSSCEIEKAIITPRLAESLYY